MPQARMGAVGKRLLGPFCQNFRQPVARFAPKLNRYLMPIFVEKNQNRIFRLIRHSDVAKDINNDARHHQVTKRHEFRSLFGVATAG